MERRPRFVALDVLRKHERPDPFSRVEPADELAVGKRLHLRNRYAAGCQVCREFARSACSAGNDRRVAIIRLTLRLRSENVVRNV